MAKESALVLNALGIENFEVKEYPVPEPADDAVLVKVAMCGICGTDVHIVSGKCPILLPFVLGHEWYGPIVAMGKNVKADFQGKPVKVGDLVTPALGKCGKCWFCRNTARDQLCEVMAFPGVCGYEECNVWPHFTGGWGPHVYLPAAVPFYKIPDGMTPDEMVLAEPMDVMTRVWERCVSANSALIVGEGVDIASTMVIQGQGPIGSCLSVIARAHGMANIIVIDPIQARVDKSLKLLGTKHGINRKDLKTADALADAVKDLTGGRGADLVVECTGEPPAFGEALKMVRRGGTVVEMGHFSDTGTVAVNPHVDFCHKDVQVFGMWAHTARDMKLALETMVRAKAMGIKFGDIVLPEKIRSLDKIPEGMLKHEAHELPGKICYMP